MRPRGGGGGRGSQAHQAQAHHGPHAAQAGAVHLHAVGEHGLDLGQPALAHAPGVGAHVRRDHVHLALLEVGVEVLAVHWTGGGGRVGGEREGEGEINNANDLHFAVNVYSARFSYFGYFLSQC